MSFTPASQPILPAQSVCDGDTQQAYRAELTSRLNALMVGNAHYKMFDRVEILPEQDQIVISLDAVRGSVAVAHELLQRWAFATATDSQESPNSFKPLWKDGKGNVVPWNDADNPCSQLLRCWDELHSMILDDTSSGYTWKVYRGFAVGLVGDEKLKPEIRLCFSAPTKTLMDILPNMLEQIATANARLSALDTHPKNATTTGAEICDVMPASYPSGDSQNSRLEKYVQRVRPSSEQPPLSEQFSSIKR